MGNRWGAWLRVNNGRIVHPAEVLGVLGEIYKYPAHKYAFFEEKGHLIPRGCHDGKVDAVLVYFPIVRPLTAIAKEHGLEAGVLRRGIFNVSHRGSLPVESLGFSDEVLADLQEDGYISRFNGSVRLGRRGYRFVESRMPC